MSLSGRLEQAVTDTENYTEIFNQFVNGDDQTEVITSGGPVSSIAKAIKDLEDYYVNNNIVTSAESARDEAKVQAILSSGFADEASSDAAESLMYRNQASGFSVSASNAQIAAESARNLSQTYRNQASGFSASALGFSIEASGYAEQAQIDYSNAIKNDGTILQSGKIPVIQGSGILGESDKSFGTSHADIYKSEDFSRVVTAGDLFFSRGLGFTEWDFESGLNTNVIEVSGSIVSNEGKTIHLSTSTTAGSGARRCNGGSVKLLSPSSNMRVLSGQRRFFMMWRLGVQGSGFTENSEIRAFYGHLSTDPIGPLVRQGFGFLLKGSTTRKIYGIYHTGTGSEVEVDLGVSQWSETTVFLSIYLDGAGNIEWAVNGVVVGSASGLSTSLYEQGSRFGYEVTNKTDEANASLYAGSITLGQAY